MSGQGLQLRDVFLLFLSYVGLHRLAIFGLYFGKIRFYQKTSRSPPGRFVISPVELLVLGALRYLGQGWTFDDIEESTAINHDVHCVFLHHFINFGSTVLFEQYVVAIPNAISRLSTNLHPRNHDLSGVGPGEDITGEEMVSSERSNRLLQSSVSNLSLAEFRKRLVEHFDLSFHRNDIVWPTFN